MHAMSCMRYLACGRIGVLAVSGFHLTVRCSTFSFRSGQMVVVVEVYACIAAPGARTCRRSANLLRAAMSSAISPWATEPPICSSTDKKADCSGAYYALCKQCELCTCLHIPLPT